MKEHTAIQMKFSRKHVTYLQLPIKNRCFPAWFIHKFHMSLKTAYEKMGNCEKSFFKQICNIPPFEKKDRDWVKDEIRSSIFQSKPIFRTGMIVSSSPLLHEVFYHLKFCAKNPLKFFLVLITIVYNYL